MAVREATRPLLIGATLNRHLDNIGYLKATLLGANCDTASSVNLG